MSYPQDPNHPPPTEPGAGWPPAEQHRGGWGRSEQDPPPYGQQPSPPEPPQYGEQSQYGQSPQYGQSSQYGQPSQYGQQSASDQQHYGQQPTDHSGGQYGTQQYGQSSQYGHQQYGQSQYGAQQYGQAQYSPSQYGQQQYSTPSSYGAPYGQVYPTTAVPTKSRKGPLLGVLAVLVVAVIVVGGIFLATSLGGKRLDHAAVEKTIEQQSADRQKSFQTLSNVKCNNGKNPDVKAGTSFTCTASGGKTVTVRITDDDADWTWALGS